MYTPFDKLDYYILQELRKNSRTPAVEIARKLGESERKIRKRIERMIDLGIGRFTVIIDPPSFGFGITVDIFMEVQSGSVDSITEKLLKFPELCFVANCQEKNCLSIEARFKTMEDLYNFLNYTIPSIEGVQITHHTIISRVLKDIDGWVPPEKSFGSFNS
ncbi:MAG: Lrp/AsnC family transcriptional regulator [Spirochaetales bacterium]|nr:Lrp/AsnC family transcriptional regulator [Spirochaetales bacterium]